MIEEIGENRPPFGVRLEKGQVFLNVRLLSAEKGDPPSAEDYTNYEDFKAALQEYEDVDSFPGFVIDMAIGNLHASRVVPVKVSSLDEAMFIKDFAIGVAKISRDIIRAKIEPK